MKVIAKTEIKTEKQVHSFKQYLIKQGYTKHATQAYGYIINTFLLAQENAIEFGYSDILSYLDELRKVYKSAGTLTIKLSAIKKYFDYLIDQGIREDHPCKRLYLKAQPKKEVIQNDLFNPSELETLLNKKSRFICLRTKHQVVISLFIYQGLLPGEITYLKLNHIDLDNRTVFINGGKVLSSRRLEMHPRQYDLFEQYLNHDRKQLLKGNKSDHFIINLLGKNDTPDAVINCVETMKGLFPDRNLTAKTIRDSVISNLLNERGLPLEQVQLFAGHRWICSTQRYQQASIEEEREILRQFHPLE